MLKDERREEMLGWKLCMLGWKCQEEEILGDLYGKWKYLLHS